MIQKINRVIVRQARQRSLFPSSERVTLATCEVKIDITFLGATGTVTGSKYLVTSGSKTVLVDCGLFQGFKQWRLKNWEPLSVVPRHIEAVILTHAHIGHSGYLPLLVKN